MFTFRPYQVTAAEVLSDILVRKRFAIDASDTGIGKTFTAIKTVMKFNPVPPVAVICRASAVTKWRAALAMFNITPIFLMSWDKSRSKKNGFFIPVRNRRGKVTGFNLQLREATIVIIDEIHAGGAIKSQNAELIIAAKRCPNAFILGLSATIADTPLKLNAIGFACGLHTLGSDYQMWCRKNGCGKGPFGGLYFRVRDREWVLAKLHRHFFVDDPWGIRLRKKDLMDIGQFPVSETFVEVWDVGKTPSWLVPWMDGIDAREEQDMEKHDWNPHAGILAMRDRQRAEMLKVPALIEEIRDKLEEGESVCVFLQFTKTIHVVSERLADIPHSIVAGTVPRSSSFIPHTRDEMLDLFQTNEHRLIILQTDAGSESIDLHDTLGGHPRHVIIFPTYKSVTLIQVLGRAVRSGGMTPVVQRIIYASGGIEEKIAKVVERRLENLSMLSDGELNAGGMI